MAVRNGLHLFWFMATREQQHRLCELSGFEAVQLRFVANGHRVNPTLHTALRIWLSVEILRQEDPALPGMKLTDLLLGKGGDIPEDIVALCAQLGGLVTATV